jgi:hypothetical protein
MGFNRRKLEDQGREAAARYWFLSVRCRAARRREAMRASHQGA